MIKKTVCFTIDVEPDFGGKGKHDSYFGLQDLPKIAKLVKKYDLNKLKLYDNWFFTFGDYDTF